MVLASLQATASLVNDLVNVHEPLAGLAIGEVLHDDEIAQDVPSVETRREAGPWRRLGEILQTLPSETDIAYVEILADQGQVLAQRYLTPLLGPSMIPSLGTKEMPIRANQHAAGGQDLDLFHALKPVFENVAMAKVGTSAEECRELGYFRREDRYSMNTQRLVADAKETALGLARSGWRPGVASWQERGGHTVEFRRCGS